MPPIIEPRVELISGGRNTTVTGSITAYAQFDQAGSAVKVIDARGRIEPTDASPINQRRVVRVANVVVILESRARTLDSAGIINR